MIPGFNHNIKYKGRVFHCQTEDSGLQNPHIITHLFVGGNILATKKTSYADIVKADRLEEVVTELMKEQHKELIKKLVSGSFDGSIEERSQGAAMLNGPAPLNVEAGSQNRASFGMRDAGPAPQKKPAAPVPAPVAAAPAVKPAAPAAPTVAKPKAPVPMPIPMPVVATSLAVPQEVLDAAALQKLPEPSRPASGTIFGEDLISEKSLDEVILSYLADETNH